MILYNTLKKIWLYSTIISSTLFLWGCFSSSTKNVDTSQIISFSSYQMDITNSYTEKKVDERVDPRVAGKIISLYVAPTGWGYDDNVVISTDKLSPNASLEDYVQASIGGMSYTRGKYKSLNFQKGSLNCSALTIPTITNTFSINRIAPTTNSSETIYFVQYYAHKSSEVVTVSASTSNKDNVTSLQQMMATISCNLTK